MSARVALPVALVLLAALLPLSSADGERFATAYYVGPGDFASASAQGMNVGGATFMPNPGERSVQIVAVDSHAGHRVTITVCQDTNRDGICGDAAEGEPSITGCGTATLSANDRRAFDPSVEVSVFVHGAGFIFSGGCPALTTVSTGFITAGFR